MKLPRRPSSAAKAARSLPGRLVHSELGRVMASFESLERLLAQRQALIEQRLELVERELARAGLNSPEGIRAAREALDPAVRDLLAGQAPVVPAASGAKAARRLRRLV